ncbi:N-acetylmuramic acid 6-phosphate etherase [Priestia filamentosa]|uniref:N-acetylmuramic acid 6-phosphate etherase n=1 Tax=Priestia filamentosa TaxID=1402861 RepID=A0A1X7F772_9BACI|nr:N-acetylmuramic acid 6-phosphate etherase [Priestia filamentosa]AKO91781.1 N-acetylmuramic acid 6-phosphate etherase [Priestia filamentosa]MDT3761922.1 N-acetylmuramic acid 6-phosphate etherase [Priestia filamentosa]OXS68006.1 N-acetylmuramic acid 6-phosphate etherase [Priestia filamentosa]RJS64794.1 N-acetylmuramic acid 6-phosphate etherase [Priestia filamentosa]WCM17010.1 N-acetylmuramic acid 6-phosphate etherase [Priestia filamentosa]
MLERLGTERRNNETEELDTMSIQNILRIMNEEDKKVPEAIQKELENVERAVRLVVESFKSGGRLLYVGAGTSGRLGVLDAVECPPTFGTDPNLVKGVMAGGESAFIKAVEAAEDREDLGAEDMKLLNVTSNDTVIGIAASGRTPYVIGALRYARERGASTCTISCNKETAISALADVAIEVDTGPEVLTGSTRLKAGTAQKLLLNMISTVSMIQIGKVYKNLMVDVQPTNEKLVERSKRIIMEATSISYEEASTYYDQSKQNIKVAILMALTNCTAEEAETKLQASNGFVRQAL